MKRKLAFLDTFLRKRPRPQYIRSFTTAQAKFRKDYEPPKFTIDECNLDFYFDDDKCIVTNTSSVRSLCPGTSELMLDGNKSFIEKLHSLKLNGEPITNFQVDETSLRISVPNDDKFELEIVTMLNPETNKQLEGLYASGGKFVTQCEPEGFRNITYFLDRPDVTTKFSTTLNAEASLPVLLSNGNLTDYGSDEIRCWARWEDPYKKPSYLFAVVAGDLECVEDYFTTKEGRKVLLRMYTESHNVSKCGFAMGSLIRSMKWDEDRFDLCYDLDIYNVVVVDDFNMGAMENRSLNIFNSKLLLADPETQTDEEFKRIEGVIGHEYFHNWTGNRVTLRDWFQLSLKEGLTVFRDQEFSEDMCGSGVKRIDEVKLLQARQFLEDAGPMAHPVRPDEYIEMNNFYTVTVYEKGAEVVRMLQTMLGKEKFKEGLQRYLSRHDGDSCTVEDFVICMEEVSGVNLQQFYLWYSQSGTPVVSVTSSFDAEQKTLTLKLKQSCPSTPGQTEEKQPFLMPMGVALFDPDSGMSIDGTGQPEVLTLTDREHTFTFENVPTDPVISLNRGFTAPVYVQYPQTLDDMALLTKHDTDTFNKYSHCQKMMSLHIVSKYFTSIADETSNPIIDERVLNAFRQILKSAKEPNELFLLSRMLQPPDFSYLFPLIADQSPDRTADPIKVALAIEWFVNSLGYTLHNEFLDRYTFCRDFLADRSKKKLKGDPIEQWRTEAKYRALANACLPYIVSENKVKKEYLDTSMLVLEEQLNLRRNMTEVLSALHVLVNRTRCEPKRDEYMLDFYERFQHDPLVVQKWLRLQSTSNHPRVVDHVTALLKHEAYDSTNPNSVFALLGGFAMANPLGFHTPRGYDLVVDQIISLDQTNASLSARLCGAFESWQCVPKENQKAIEKGLRRILKSKPSKGLYEKASKCLAASPNSSYDV